MPKITILVVMILVSFMNVNKSPNEQKFNYVILKRKKKKRFYEA